MQPSNQLLPDRPTRLIVVGAYLGRAVFGSALGTLEQLHVAGVVDEDTKSARGWARELPGRPPAYASPQKAIDAEDQIDGALIACPLLQRCAIIEQFVCRGKPVLTVFPYAYSVQEMERLVEIARANNTWILPAIPEQYSDAFCEVQRTVAAHHGGISFVRCEARLPMTAAYAIENGVAPFAIDWYDLLVAVACRTVALSECWLGKPLTVNSDIDLPHHSDIAGRRPSDPVANVIITHEFGQSTHLLKLSRSVQPFERYLLTGMKATIEIAFSGGSGEGQSVRLERSNQHPEAIYTQPEDEDPRAQSCVSMLLDFVHKARSFSSDTADQSDERETREHIVNRQAAARQVLEAVQAAFVSAREGIRITLPLHSPPDINTLIDSPPQTG